MLIKAAHQTWSQKTLSKTRKILSMTPNPSFSIASTCNVTFAFANPFLLAEFTFWSGSVGWNKVLWEALSTPRETVQMATWLKKENHSLICFLKKMTPCVFRSFCCDHVDLIFTPFYLDNLRINHIYILEHVQEGWGSTEDRVATKQTWPTYNKTNHNLTITVQS